MKTDRRTAAFLAGCLVVGLAAVAGADELRCRVVGVTDGDTITVLDEAHVQHKVRLNGIDAPESSQAFGQVSKQHLSSLVFGRDVTVTWKKVDLYRRLVGTVLLNGVDENLEQIRAGLAWYFRKYSSDVAVENRASYDSAEISARAAHAGLWRDPRPTPPWEYRHPDTAVAPAAASAHSAAPAREAQATHGLVIGNRASHIYHVPGCRDYDKVAEHNRVYFKTDAAAEAAGYRHAKNCS